MLDNGQYRSSEFSTNNFLLTEHEVGAVKISHRGLGSTDRTEFLFIDPALSF